LAVIVGDGARARPYFTVHPKNFFHTTQAPFVSFLEICSDTVGQPLLAPGHAAHHIILKEGDGLGFPRSALLDVTSGVQKLYAICQFLLPGFLPSSTLLLLRRKELSLSISDVRLEDFFPECQTSPAMLLLPAHTAFFLLLRPHTLGPTPAMSAAFFRYTIPTCFPPARTPSLLSFFPSLFYEPHEFCRDSESIRQFPQMLNSRRFCSAFRPPLLAVAVSKTEIPSVASFLVSYYASRYQVPR